MSGRQWVAVGAASAAAAVALGAFGDHGLEGQLTAERLETFEVGVRYHLIHSLGLILIGMLAERWQGRLPDVAARFLASGILLFSGGLYVWCLAALRPAVHFVPVGGVAFIAGWITLAIAAWRQK